MSERAENVSVLVRFAVPLGSPNRANLLQSGILNDVEWLENRRMLFETYCRPSLEWQTSHDWHLYLALDERTNENFVSGLQDSLKQDTSLVHVKDGESVAEAFERALPKVSTSCITLRLDSDDILMPTFISQVKRRASEGRLLNFPNIAMFDTASHAVVSRFPYYRNPFLSYCGRDNVFALGEHGRTTQAVVNIWTASPMAIQLVHGTNVRNSTEGRKRARQRAAKVVVEAVRSLEGARPRISSSDNCQGLGVRKQPR